MVSGADLNALFSTDLNVNCYKEWAGVLGKRGSVSLLPSCRGGSASAPIALTP